MLGGNMDRTEFLTRRERNLKDIMIQITGVENLEVITEITLRMTSDEYPLNQLSFLLPSLCKLVLNGSNIKTLRELGAKFEHLVKLNVRNCSLTSLDGLLPLKNLKVLDAACNYIRCVSYVSVLKYLECLNVSKNCICDLNPIIYLQKCESLRSFSLSQNPCCETPEYRQWVISKLPRIENLDGVPTKVPEKRLIPETIICGNITTSLGRNFKHQQQRKDTADGTGLTEEMHLANKRTLSKTDYLLRAAIKWKDGFDNYKTDKL